jgi:hypothetical protein
MKTIQISDDEYVTTPIYAGFGMPSQLCQDDKHQWVEMSVPPAVHEGFELRMEQCSICKYNRGHGRRVKEEKSP